MNGKSHWDDVALIIFSCDKFSDLWDANITLLDQNWGDRELETYIVTDKPSMRSFQGVKIISASAGLEFSDRVAEMLGQVEKKYFFVLLDDYFLINKVNTKAIRRCADIVAENDLDYLRVYTYLNGRYNKKLLSDYSDVCIIETDARYKINMYPSFFSRRFLEKTVDEKRNIWQYEVMLTMIGERCGTKCAMMRNNSITMLDVVRKGKILRKANRYLKKTGIYHGSRPVIGLMSQIKLDFVFLMKLILPRRITLLIRKVLMKCGVHFYSEMYKQ